MSNADRLVSSSQVNSRPHVVVLGAGFAGLFATRALARKAVDITLIDRHNYHLFQPLLYQVATAGLAPSEIAWPIRSILSAQKNVTVILDEVRDVDTAANAVITQSRNVAYDYLIVATGARHAYFGHPHWEEHAPGLKSVDDATRIRQRILMAFEKAEMTSDPEERKRLLTFVVVGAGPTGIELAGTIAELSRWTLVADFRHIDSRTARIVLIEAGSRVLATMPEPLSDYAKKSLVRLGVEVRLGAPVTECDAEGVVVDGQRLPSSTVLWAAGVQASPAAQWLGCEADAAGRVVVEQNLSAPGLPDVFVVGDTASVTDVEDKVVPGVAPAAKQQGRYVAEVIKAKLKGDKMPAGFRYRDAGNLATIGRKSA
ncbi:MAG: NAD(P)/FAD-dependent oxidoreductase, partial [Pseudomonadota bacterium]